MARLLLLAVAVLVLTAGCAQPIAGSAHADPAVTAQLAKETAQLAKERGCQAAGEALITTVRTLLQRVETGDIGGGSIDAVLAEVPFSELGSNLGRQCGRELIGAQYSRVVVEVNAMTPATIVGRIAQHGTLSGLCPPAGTTIVLDQQARLVCAGR